MEEVGKRLQAVRRFYGWSQRELAKRAQVPNSAISVIEQGSVSPSITSLTRVLKALSLSLSDFFSLDLSGSCITQAISESASEDLFPGTSTLLGKAKYSLGDSGLSGHSVELRSVEAQSLPPSLITKDTLLVVTSGNLDALELNSHFHLGVGDSLSIKAPCLVAFSSMERAEWVSVTFS